MAGYKETEQLDQICFCVEKANSLIVTNKRMNQNKIVGMSVKSRPGQSQGLVYKHFYIPVVEIIGLQYAVL